MLHNRVAVFGALAFLSFSSPGMAQAITTGTADAANALRLKDAERMISTPEGADVNVLDGKERMETLSREGYRPAMVALAELLTGGKFVPVDYPEARHWLEVASSEGDASATMALAELLQSEAFGDDVDFVQAATLLKGLADAGNTNAAIQFARMQIEGKGMAPNPNEGIRSLENFGANGQAGAYVLLGNIFLAGKFVTASPSTAVQYLREAAGLGDRGAKRLLGNLLLTGDLGVEISAEEGAALLQEASDEGDGQATRILARARILGDGVSQDLEKGLLGFNSLIEAGNVVAMRELANLYLGGTGVKPDPSLATSLLERAANQGDITSIRQLGHLMRTGQSDVAIDLTKARKWFENGSAEGDVTSKIQLADMMLKGEGGISDSIGAISLLEQAGATKELATLYLRGEYVPTDVERAISLLEKGIESKDSRAAQFLITIYRTGYLGKVPRSLPAARSILDRARAWLPSKIFHTEAAFLDALNGQRGFDQVVMHLAELESGPARVAFRQLRTINVNAYVFASQMKLKEFGLFDENVDGQLTRATISAVNRACDANDVLKECSSGPLTSRASFALANILYP